MNKYCLLFSFNFGIYGIGVYKEWINGLVIPFRVLYGFSTFPAEISYFQSLLSVFFIY